MKFASFEDIQAWQVARVLMQKIRKICMKPASRKDFAWIDQICKAGLSVMANIAEGNDAQTNAGFIAFLGYAKRSAAEVRSHLYYGLDASYLTQAEFDECAELAKKICAQLAKLIGYLRTTDLERPRNQTSNEQTRNENHS